MSICFTEIQSLHPSHWNEHWIEMPRSVKEPEQATHSHHHLTEAIFMSSLRVHNIVIAMILLISLTVSETDGQVGHHSLSLFLISKLWPREVDWHSGLQSDHVMAWTRSHYFEIWVCPMLLCCHVLSVYSRRRQGPARRLADHWPHDMSWNSTVSFPVIMLSGLQRGRPAWSCWYPLLLLCTSGIGVELPGCEACHIWTFSSWSAIS